MKKIVIIGSIPPPYHGSNVYMKNLLESKISSVFQISHLDISDHRSLDNLSRLDFTNVYIALKNLIKLIILLRKTEPDTVYIPVSSNFLPYLRDGLFILISGLFSKAGIVIHLHEGDYFRKYFYRNSSQLNKKFIEYSLSKVDTAIVYSERLKYNFEGLVKNIVAFPNGMNPETDSAAGDRENHSGIITVSFYSNFFESKGILDVLESIPLILKKYSSVKFQFAGTWTEKDTKEKAFEIIRKNNTEKFINFNGVITGDRKINFLKDTDIMLFPTWYPYEGCPMVIIEAMSYSLPVISTKDTGAIPEMIIDGETGFLIEKKNPVEISESVLNLAMNKDLRMKMGKAGRKRFEELFTLDRNIENIINTLNKV